MEPTIQNGSHDSWKQRCVKEEKHALKSMAKCIELGMIRNLPIITSANTTLAGNEICKKLIKDQHSLANKRERDSFKHPLCMLEHSPNNKELFKSIEEIMGRYNIGPYGVSPPRENKEVEQPKVRRYLWEKPVGIRTFRGKALLPYMRSSVELAHPEIERVELLKEIRAKSPSLPCLEKSRCKSLSRERLNELKTTRSFKFMEVKKRLYTTEKSRRVEETNGPCLTMRTDRTGKYLVPDLRDPLIYEKQVLALKQNI